MLNHSDQESQYSSEHFQKLLADHARTDLLVAAIARHDAGRERRAVLLPWEPLLEWLRDRLIELCA